MRKALEGRWRSVQGGPIGRAIDSSEAILRAGPTPEGKGDERATSPSQAGKGLCTARKHRDTIFRAAQSGVFEGRGTRAKGGSSHANGTAARKS